MPNKCSHKFIHLETIYKKEYQGFGGSLYLRIDRFFCEKCAEELVKKKEGCHRERPDWYNGK